MQVVDNLSVLGSDGLVQSAVPLTVNGQTQAHVVIASRQHIPDDATVVPAQFVSPFAALGLQARSASYASSQTHDSGS